MGKHTVYRQKTVAFFVYAFNIFPLHFPKVVDLSQLDFDLEHRQKIVRQSISEVTIHFL